MVIYKQLSSETRAVRFSDMENINRGLLYSALGNLFDVTAVVFRGSNL